MTFEEMIERKNDLGYTDEKLAQLSGLSVDTVRNIFGSIKESPESDALKALENVFEELRQYDREVSGTNCFCENTPYMAGSSAEKINFKKQGEYTLEDYYDLPDERRVELIDGVIYDMSSPRITHQIIADKINMRFSNFIERNKGKCITVTAPLDVQLDMDNKTMVEPDVLILCDRSKLKNGIVFGAPDLVVEILSPSTRSKDMVLKLKKYCFAGVREYWIVDPKNKNIMVYKFEDEIECKVYERQTPVPVGIWSDECLIDFDEIFKYIEEIDIQE